MADAKPNAKFDIFPRVAKHLDGHLALAILSNFVRENGIYSEQSCLKAELAIARKTRLAEFAIELYKQLHGEGAAVPADLVAAEAAVLPDMQRHVAACGPLIDIIGIDEAPKQLAELREAGAFHMEHLREEFGVTDEHVEALLACAKFRYDAGVYRGALAYLDLYEELRYPPKGRDEVPLDVMWGKFAAAMMDEEGLWEQADEERMAIADALRRRPMPDVQRLQQRAWLLHWSLFILANYPKRREQLIEFFMADENLTTMTLTCPWLLRYVIAAVLPQRRKSFYTKALLRLLTPEALALGDPMVTFLHSLLVNFDFEAAQAVIGDCCAAIATDFFLTNMVSPEDFLGAARTFLFDVYCRVHQKIDLRLLASQVHMELDDAEKWVVGLIRSAQLDAKVDSQAKTVEMLQPAPSLHWQIADRTRDVAARTRQLLEAVEYAAESARARY